MRERAILILATATLAVLLGGCEEPTATRQINCFVRPAELAKVQRVIFVELYDEAQAPEIARDTSETLFRAINGRNLCYVELVRATDARCTALPANRFGPYTLPEIAEMRKAMDADALLIGKVNTFQPYPRMQIGLYLRLVNLRDGQTIWGVDHVWDAREKKTEHRIKEYFEHNLGKGYEPVDWSVGAISPSLFEKFVAHEVARTLPGPAEK